jgi:ribosomal protein S18
VGIFTIRHRRHPGHIARVQRLLVVDIKYYRFQFLLEHTGTFPATRTGTERMVSEKNKISAAAVTDARPSPATTGTFEK